MLRKIENKECPFGPYLRSKLCEWGHIKGYGNISKIIADINVRAGYQVLSRNDLYTWFKKGPSLQNSGDLRSREEEVFGNLFGDEWSKVPCLCPRKIPEWISMETLRVLTRLPSTACVQAWHVPFVEKDLEIHRYWGDQFGFHTNIFELLKQNST